MLDKFSKTDQRPHKEGKQVVKSESSKSYESKLREKLGPGHATAWKKSAVTPESMRERQKNFLPDGSTIEQLKNFLPDGLTAKRVTGFILWTMMASAQRIGGVEVPGSASSALDLWQNHPPAHSRNASLLVCPAGSEPREYSRDAALPVCPADSEHLRDAPSFFDPKYIQELKHKLEHPPFFFEGPKDAQETSDEKPSQTDAPPHQLGQSTIEKEALTWRNGLIITFILGMGIAQYRCDRDFGQQMREERGFWATDAGRERGSSAARERGFWATDAGRERGSSATAATDGTAAERGSGSSATAAGSESAAGNGFSATPSNRSAAAP